MQLGHPASSLHGIRACHSLGHQARNTAHNYSTIHQSEDDRQRPRVQPPVPDTASFRHFRHLSLRALYGVGHQPPQQHQLAYDEAPELDAVKDGKDGGILSE